MGILYCTDNNIITESQFRNRERLSCKRTLFCLVLGKEEEEEEEWYFVMMLSSRDR